jgi:hypothetical protein
MGFEFRFVGRCAFKWNFSSLIFMAGRWAYHRLAYFTFKFTFICCLCIKLGPSWFVLRVALALSRPGNLFLFVIFFIFSFAIEFATSFRVFLSMELVPFSLYLVRSVEIIIACFQKIWVIMTLCVLIFARGESSAWNLVGFIVVMVSALSLKLHS